MLEFRGTLQSMFIVKDDNIAAWNVQSNHKVLMKKMRRSLNVACYSAVKPSYCLRVRLRLGMARGKPIHRGPIYVRRSLSLNGNPSLPDLMWRV